MITPKEIALPDDAKGIKYALTRAWRELVRTANYHLIQWRDEGADLGGVGQVNKVNFTGAGVTTSVIDDTLTVTVSGGGGGGLSDGDYGDITVSGGATVLTIDNDVVTFAKMQNVATDVLLGRDTAGTGDIEQISLGTNLSLSGGVLNAAGGSLTWVSATANIPQGRGVFEYEQTVAVAGMTSANKVLLMLDPATDADENQAEGVDLLSWTAKPATGSFLLSMQFRELHSGPIKFFYQVS